MGADFFSIHEIKAADKLLKNSANILDIGSNIGNHSVYWGVVRKARRIYAFEPMCDVFEILCKNIELNSLQSVVVPHNFALGQSEGKASVNFRPLENLGGTSIKSDESGDLSVKSLDSLEFSEKIDLMKIDVEGFERQVLLGAKAFLKAHKPIILIEIWEGNFKEMSEVLRSLDYKMKQKLSCMDYIFVPKG